jgi:4,5-dihydroxyphthalate decarboxylase
MSKLRLTMSCWDYDRTRLLMDGRVHIEGIELNYLNLPIEETFFRMMRHQESLSHAPSGIQGFI